MSVLNLIAQQLYKLVDRNLACAININKLKCLCKSFPGENYINFADGGHKLTEINHARIVDVDFLKDFVDVVVGTWFLKLIIE